MFLKSEDDAWDATQEIFIKLHKAMPNIDKKESVHSWLMSTTNNFCISMLRRKKTVEFNEEMHSSGDTASLQDKRLILKEIVSRLMKPWDEKTRQVVIYTYVDGYRQEEIARLTGMGESTIRKYLTRFRRKSQELKKDLEGIYG
jgi:RNA polymerase sigma-70 factor, ECF subfamily